MTISLYNKNLTKVPDVIGRPYDMACGILDKNELLYEKIGDASDMIVVEQSVKSGSITKKQTIVELRLERKEIGNEAEGKTNESEQEITETINEIKGLSFDGEFIEGDDKKEFVYKAPVSGIYRFKYRGDSYIGYLLNSEGEELAYAKREEGGITVKLSSGVTYILRLYRIDGAQYGIDICVPDEIRTITDPVVVGEFTYEDEVDRYLYLPTVTGEYQFEFTVIKNYDYELKLTMYELNSSEPLIQDSENNG